MDSIVTEASLLGASYTQVGFQGHWEEEGRLRQLQVASIDDWLNDLSEAINDIKLQFPEKKIVPFAYSTGALVLSRYLINNPDSGIEKLVMWAPAFSLRPMSKIAKFLSFYKSLLIPSLAPKKMRANNFTPVQTYLTIINECERQQEELVKLKNIRGLVFIDPKDEMIDASGIAELIDGHKDSKWELEYLHKKPYHHLIVDKNLFEPDVWEESITKIKSFIQNGDV